MLSNKIFLLLLHVQIQHTSNQQYSCATGSSGPCPRLGTGAEAASPHHHLCGIVRLTNVKIPISGCVSDRVWGCLILQCPVKSPNSLLRSQDATPVQRGQDLSLLSMCFDQAVVERLLTTSYLNSFFPFHAANISPRQTQIAVLYTVFEMYT